MLDEHADDIAVAAFGGQRQSRHPIVGRNVAVGSEFQKERDHLRETFLSVETKQRTVAAHFCYVVGRSAAKKKQPGYLSEFGLIPTIAFIKLIQYNAVNYLDIGAEEVADGSERRGDIVSAQRHPDGLEITRWDGHFCSATFV